MKACLAGKIQRLLGVPELARSQTLTADRLQDLRQALGESLAETLRVFLAETLRVSQAAAERQGEAANASLQAMLVLLERLDSRLAELAAEAKQVLTPPDEPPPSLDDASLEKLESQGLFILGSARSGTTVLTKCLNSRPEIFLLEEPNFFQHGHIQDFVGFFNAMHEAMGNCHYKGTYVSPSAAVERGPLALLLRLGRQHRYAGAKEAFGPHDYPPNWKRLCLDHHAAYFSGSPHLLTVRTPNEALWSMHKLFPWSPIPRLFEAWLESLALTIDVYRVCPNSYWMFFNDFGKPALDWLGRLLGVEIDVPETMLGGSLIRSRLKEGELPPALAPHAGLYRECHELFCELRDNTSRESRKYSGTVAEWHFFDALQQQIRSLVERSRSANEPQRAAA
ncbi:MAG TPA: hypothetical protein VMV10_30850 [Pirellulales bacterium]|nr:hypothetical protein [Pirellulales bacterium]